MIFVTIKTICKQDFTFTSTVSIVIKCIFIYFLSTASASSYSISFSPPQLYGPRIHRPTPQLAHLIIIAVIGRHEVVQGRVTCCPDKGADPPDPVA